MAYCREKMLYCWEIPKKRLPDGVCNDASVAYDSGGKLRPYGAHPTATCGAYSMANGANVTALSKARMVCDDGAIEAIDRPLSAG